jgi:hypothetical protein
MGSRNAVTEGPLKELNFMVSLCTREDSAQPNNWGPSSWDHLKKCPQKSTSPKIGD